MRWLSDSDVENLRRVAELPDLGDTRYRLLEELGRGGMGIVYLAEDRVLERKVALKVAGTSAAGAEAADRLRREARVVARLEHPGIVPIHDAGTLPDGRMFYAMKRVDGRRLDELAGGMPLPDRLRVFQRICEAVAFAHAHGVLHRDLKPENVMVGSFGEVLVMDWGVARLLDSAANTAAGLDAAPPPASTAEGSVVGTLSYMAPEQAAGARTPVETPADVYALGAILYFLLTLRAPFEGEAAQKRARGEPAAVPPPPRRLAPATPRPLESIAGKAMALSPTDRYASADELRAEIARYLDGERVLSHRESLSEGAGRVFARYRAPILLITAYLLMRSLLLLYGRR